MIKGSLRPKPAKSHLLKSVSMIDTTYHAQIHAVTCIAYEHRCCLLRALTPSACEAEVGTGANFCEGAVIHD